MLLAAAAGAAGLPHGSWRRQRPVTSSAAAVVLAVKASCFTSSHISDGRQIDVKNYDNLGTTERDRHHHPDLRVTRR
ncbi:MAG TPA: hypothetical protein VNS83_03550 [Lapillicoccus sp.]|nr:hypothetical protein [Lapillicoccus sp.]